MEVTWARNEVNKHKGHGGWQCECCGHGKNGLRRRRRAPRYMLRALAQGKKIHYYPFPHFSPPYTPPPYEENEAEEDETKYVLGLSSWKKTLKRRPTENLWWCDDENFY